jgi:putative transposase
VGQLILKGYDNDDIVDITEVSTSSVKNWRRKLKQSDGELHALARKKGSGREPKLDNVQKQRLKEIILVSAVAAGYPSERWTSKIVADLIRRVFHVNLAASSVRRVLRSLGLSPQLPVVKSHKYSDEAVLEWAKRTWKRLKKSEETRHSFDFP